ncbi:Rrf2 family transcriptional regulator [Desulfovibrio sp. OttesenSCG-928-F20]|nr:Rrf2 family transcriptional regulator [Desulfovibrio sp. OttesenSCG-928-F20]
MKFSTSTRYAIRLLFELHRSNMPISMASLSVRTDISHKTLAAIHGVLKDKGVTTARIGAKGGLILLRPLREISLGQVLEWFNDNIEISVCCGDKNRLNHLDQHPSLRTLSEKMQKKLNALMLSDIVDAVE